MINKAVIYFTKGNIATTNKTTNLCLEIIHFEMSSTLISFNGYSYKYHGWGNKEQRLEIGGYESDFLSDLFASCLFKNNKDLFLQKIYHDIYRVYSLVFLKGKKKLQELEIGQEDFNI